MQSLIYMINTELSSVGDVRNAESIGALRDVEQSYANTLTHIRQQKHKVEDGTADRYSTLVV
jgi:hypothetical protein